MAGQCPVPSKHCLVLFGVLTFALCQVVHSAVVVNMSQERHGELLSNLSVEKFVEFLETFKKETFSTSELSDEILSKFTKHFEPDAYMNVSTLIESKGFPCEIHTVTTQDGFILTLMRIPHGTNPPPNPTASRPVVLMQHGLLNSASDFLMNSANESLPFILATEGADVWLSNTRGNGISMGHKSLDPKNREFWNWSFDEMARYDTPAIVDYILKVTSQSQLFYIGHSQGGGTMLIESSRNPELKKKIAYHYALAPATRLSHTASLVEFVVNSHGNLLDILSRLNNGSTGLFPNLLIFKVICVPLGYHVCLDELYNVFGTGDKSFNITRLPVYLAHSPSPTSIQNLLHYEQLILSKQYQQYDEGSPEANMKRYGTPTPPLYDLSTYDIPTSIYWSTNDNLVQSIDVKWLMTQIPVDRNILVRHFNHMDFLWSPAASQFVYYDIVKHMMNTFKNTFSNVSHV